jgi:branched-chain amino acid transport system permease protein
VPWLGSRYDTFLATQIAINSLFGVSLNLLLGTTGLVSFGHVAYFGIGAYVCAILMKTYALPFVVAFPAAGLGAAAFALVFGFFCVRLTKIYFAMLTLAFSQIVWAVCFKWNDVTGGDQGLPDIPYPDLEWMAAVPGLTDLRIGDRFYLLTLFLVAVCLAMLRQIVRSPFGRMLTTIRDNAERAAFIGINVRAYELAAFVVAGGFAGFAGALFGIFNRGVFVDYVFWSKSAEVMIMTILGGMDYFWGPPVGALALVWLNQQITSYTEYWPLVLGILLVLLLYAFPGGIVGGSSRLFASPGAGWCIAMLDVRKLRKSFAGFVAIGGVSLTVDTCQIAAVIGPNGAGKSTLFNLITGHIRPDSGQVMLDGYDITGAAPHRICRIGIGRSFQRTNIFPRLSVFENVQAAFLAHRGRGPNFWSLSETFYREETAALLTSIGLGGQERAVAATLSYGNQKQLELGIALASDPTLLLLDEPTAGMSASETHETMRLLEQIAEARGLTLLFTEHDMEVVFAIAEKIAVLHQGCVLAEGTPAEVRADPEVRRVYLGGH